MSSDVWPAITSERFGVQKIYDSISVPPFGCVRVLGNKLVQMKLFDKWVKFLLICFFAIYVLPSSGVMESLIGQLRDVGVIKDVHRARRCTTWMGQCTVCHGVYSYIEACSVART